MGPFIDRLKFVLGKYNEEMAQLLSDQMNEAEFSGHKFTRRELELWFDLRQKLFEAYKKRLEKQSEKMLGQGESSQIGLIHRA